MASIKLSLSSPRTSWVKKAGLGKEALKSAIGAALAMGVLGAGQAQALVVTVGGQQWDVTTFTGSAIANTTKFNTAVMPWWGQQQTARAFATAVGTGLGTPNLVGGTPMGPLFGFAPYSNGGVNYINGVFSINGGWFGPINNPESDIRTYAQASLVATPVPGPLPALGAAAAFGYSRTLRKRIKATKAVGASATAG